MKKFTSYILFFVLLAMSQSLFAQQEFKTYVKAGDKAYKEKNYYEALSHYGTALEFYDQFVDVYYRYGESARMFNALTVAEEAYTTVSESADSLNYPMLNYHLADVKMKLGKYDEASHLFMDYLKNATDADDAYKFKARKLIDNCNWSAIKVENPDSTLVITHLNKEINTPYSDFGAIERNDTLYYSSYRFDNEEDEFKPVRQVTKILNSVEGTKGRKLRGKFNNDEKHTAHTAFNMAGDRIYFTICDYVTATDIRCKIYYKQSLGGERWGEATVLPDYINKPEFTATQPNIGYDDELDREVLYFVSDRLDGKGGLDIWYSIIDGEVNGGFSTPENMVDLNTTENDITPFYNHQTKSLYFSSEGYQGMGGYDIYESTKNDNYWNEPRHLGYPLNSSFNDIYYAVNEEGTKAHFSSNRLGSAYIERAKEACCNDIYEVELNAIRVFLLAHTFEDTTALAGVSLSIEEFGRGRPENLYNDESNEFRYELGQEQKYFITASKDGYYPDTMTVMVDSFSQSITLEKDFFLRRVDAEPIMLDVNALVFDNNQAELSGATLELKDIARGAKQSKYNPAGNDFIYELDPTKEYYLIAKKDGFEPDTIHIKPSQYNVSTTLTEKLYLNKKSTPVVTAAPPVTTTTPINTAPTSTEVVSKYTLDNYLPMPLYFDNDEPDSKTRRTSTTKTYGQSYTKYYSRKGIFQSQYGKDQRGEMRIAAEQEIATFFEDDVKAGFDALNGFSAALLKYLEQGNTARIILRGYASPVAQSDYNKTLTKRRISSLRNHFRNWGGGLLHEYLANRQLIIQEEPYGEDQSGSVSDNQDDAKNSIYSVQASKERRVEIIEIREN